MTACPACLETGGEVCEPCQLASGKQYPINWFGKEDQGWARETRERPCPNTWCTRSEHEGAGPCVVAPRRKLETNDYGPRRASK